MNNFLRNDRNKLEDVGFEYSEDDSTDVVRWATYTKTAYLGDMDCRLIIEIKYELALYDNPFASTADNFEYFFDDVYFYFEKEDGSKIPLPRPRLLSIDDFAAFDRFF